MSRIVQGLLAAVAATAFLGTAIAQGTPPNPAKPDPATGAGQRSTQNTPMGATGTPAGSGAATAGSTAGATAAPMTSGSTGSTAAGSTSGSTMSSGTMPSGSGSMATGSTSGDTTMAKAPTRRAKADRN